MLCRPAGVENPSGVFFKEPRIIWPKTIMKLKGFFLAVAIVQPVSVNYCLIAQQNNMLSRK